MTRVLRSLAFGGALAAFVVSWPAAASAQDAHAHGASAAATAADAAPADSVRLSPYPPAELSAETIEILVAGAAHLFPLLPHEPGGQPGSAVERYAILGSVVDSVGKRGPLALSLEEADAITAGLVERAIPARFCGAGCGGAFGEAALTFQMPFVHGDDAVLRIRSMRALAQLPGQRPDRVVHRTDEIRLRREAGGWTLAGHTMIKESLQFISTPGWDPTPR